MLRLYNVDIVQNQAEARSKIDDGGDHRRTGRRGKDQSHRIGLAANPQGMHLKRRSARGNGWADFKHVRSKHLRRVREVVGVVLHERGASGHAVSHGLHDADQRCGLPVALTGEAIAVSHEPLHRNAGELRDAMQIFKGVCEGAKATLNKERAQAELNTRRVAQGIGTIVLRGDRVSFTILGDEGRKPRCR